MRSAESARRQGDCSNGVILRARSRNDLGTSWATLIGVGSHIAAMGM